MPTEPRIAVVTAACGLMGGTVRPWTNSRTAADELREFAGAMLPARDRLRDSLATR